MPTSDDFGKKEKLEIWPQRPIYFAAAIAIHRGEQGGGMSVRGWRIMGGGVFDFGSYLVDGWRGGGGKA